MFVYWIFRVYIGNGWRVMCGDNFIWRISGSEVVIKDCKFYWNDGVDGIRLSLMWIWYFVGWCWNRCDGNKLRVCFRR